MKKQIKQIGKYFLFEEKNKIIALKLVKIRKKIFGQIIEGVFPSVESKLIFDDLEKAETILSKFKN